MAGSVMSAISTMRSSNLCHDRSFTLSRKRKFLDTVKSSIEKVLKFGGTLGLSPIAVTTRLDSTSKGLFHQKMCMMNAQKINANVANSSRDMEYPCATREILCTMSHVHWVIANALVMTSALLRSFISDSGILNISGWTST